MTTTDQVGALIARDTLFGNPDHLAPALSPDGRHIAYLAPHEGVLNVWVAGIDALDAARPLTRETPRPIQTFQWAPDSARILYVADVGGSEDYLLYGAALTGGERIAYTPFVKTRVEIIKVSPLVDDAILISANNRDPRWHDAYRLDLATGKLSLIWQNPGGYDRVTADLQLKLVLAQKIGRDGGYEIERFADDGALTPLFEVGLDDSWTTRVLGLNAAGRLHLLDSRGRDKAALSEIDLDSGAVTLLAEDAQADVQDVLLHPLTREVEGYAVDYLARTWRPVGAALAEDIALLNAAAGGVWRRLSQTKDGRYWTVEIDAVSAPPVYQLYDRQTRRLTRLFPSRPKLEGARLSTMHPVEIPARDGLTLVSYLTLPAGHDLGGCGDAPLPMVLLVHGGPWNRDVYAFNVSHQWLANRGYAVLSVNYRGSTGFGKGFVNAGNLQWGRKMHDDLLDAVDWAVAQRITTPDRVAIMGGSYGGYATLVGVTMTPEVFVCGVDIVGPSNLTTLLQTIPPYWQSAFLQFAQRMADPRTEAGRAMLVERSPLTHVERIVRPLLIGQGANDPRVNKSESDQIVEAMKAKAIPVTYALYPDEGHGFARPENRISFYALAEIFLAEHLGGAFEPIGSAFAGSSLRILDGAEQLAGLKSVALPT